MPIFLPFPRFRAAMLLLAMSLLLPFISANAGTAADEPYADESVVAPEGIKNLTISGLNGEFHHIELTDSVKYTHYLNPANRALISKVILPGGNSFEIPVSKIDSCLISVPDIPSLSFRFPDYPDAEQIWLKEEYIKATLNIRGYGVVDDAEDLSLTMKGRGNTTWNFAKKPMRMKFSKKTSICGFKKAKNYVLLANYIDPSHLRNSVTLWLGNHFESDYCNSFLPCNVFINDRYVGLFLLTEKIGINSGSVDIDEESGILFELSTEYDEPYKFRTDRYDLPVMVKDPDFDELYEDNPDGPTPEERLAIWQKDFNKALNAAINKKGADYFDIESFVNYIIVQNIVFNDEIGNPKSVYIYKDSIEGKYKFGPLWDFDAAFNLHRMKDGELISKDPEGILWLNVLFQQLAYIPEFKEIYTEKFNRFYEEGLPKLLEFIDSYGASVEKSAILDGRRWPQVQDLRWLYRMPSLEHKKHVDDLKEWIIQRVEYLRTAVDNGKLF